MDLRYLEINTVKVKQKGVSDCILLEKKLARINFWAVVSQCFSYKMFLPLNVLVTTGADVLLLEAGDQLKRNTTWVKRIVKQQL